jgi:hypothetical protein
MSIKQETSLIRKDIIKGNKETRKREVKELNMAKKEERKTRRALQKQGEYMEIKHDTVNQLVAQYSAEIDREYELLKREIAMEEQFRQNKAELKQQKAADKEQKKAATEAKKTQKAQEKEAKLGQKQALAEANKTQKAQEKEAKLGQKQALAEANKTQKAQEKADKLAEKVMAAEAKKAQKAQEKSAKPAMKAKSMKAPAPPAPAPAQVSQVFALPMKVKIPKQLKQTKNSIRPADSNSSWSVTDKEMNPSTEGADSKLQRLKQTKRAAPPSMFENPAYPNPIFNNNNNQETMGPALPHLPPPP